MVCNIEEVQQKLNAMREEYLGLEGRITDILGKQLVDCLQVSSLTKRKNWLRGLILDLERNYLDNIIA